MRTKTLFEEYIINALIKISDIEESKKHKYMGFQIKTNKLLIEFHGFGYSPQMSIEVYFINKIGERIFGLASSEDFPKPEDLVFKKMSESVYHNKYTQVICEDSYIEFNFGNGVFDVYTSNVKSMQYNIDGVITQVFEN